MKQLTHLDYSYNQIENLVGLSFKKGGSKSSSSSKTKTLKAESSRNLTAEFHNEKISRKQHKPLANSLLHLNLSNNRLYGGYPQCLDDLRLLESLDLSGNLNLFNTTCFSTGAGTGATGADTNNYDNNYQKLEWSFNSLPSTSSSANNNNNYNYYNNNNNYGSSSNNYTTSNGGNSYSASVGGGTGSGGDTVSKSAPNLMISNQHHHLLVNISNRSTLNLSQIFTVIDPNNDPSSLSSASSSLGYSSTTTPTTSNNLSNNISNNNNASAETSPATNSATSPRDGTSTIPPPQIATKISPRMSRVIRKSDLDTLNIENEILLQRKQTVSSLLISEHFHHSITEIDISSCGLVNFPIEWLRRFPKLKILKMNNNGPFGLEHDQDDDLPSTIRGLSFLRNLEMKNCLIRGSIQSLMSLSSVDYLDMSHNRLKELPQIPTEFFVTSNIETLKLGHNNLRFIHSNSMLEKLYSTITHLDLSHNYLELIQDSTLSGMLQLKHLDLSFNCLKRLPAKLFSGMKYLKNLLLCHNELVFENLFLDAASIQDLSLLKRIESINLSFNRIKCLKGIELFSETLYVLDLSYNDIRWNNQVFDGLFQLKNIEVLNLSGCGLTTHDFEQVAGNRWLDFRYLHELKLNRNCLTSLNIFDQNNSGTSNVNGHSHGSGHGNGSGHHQKKLNELKILECAFNFISLKDQQQINLDWRKIAPKLSTISTYSLYNHLYNYNYNTTTQGGILQDRIDWENPNFTSHIYESILFCDSNLLHLHNCITKEMKQHRVTHIIQIISESDERFKLCDGIDPHRFSEYIFKTYKIYNNSIEYLVVYLPSSNRLNFEKLDECVKWIEDSKEHCLISEYNPFNALNSTNNNGDKDLTMLVQQKINLFLMAPSSPPLSSLSDNNRIISDDQSSTVKAVSTHSNHSSSTSSIDFDIGGGDSKIFEASYTILIAYLVKSRQLRLECALALLRDLMILNGGNQDVTLIPYQHHLLLQYDLKLREIRYLSQSSLKRTLERDDLRTQFKHYCSTEQSSQNILFWEKVEFTYKTEYRVKERRRIAKEIFNTFIIELSALQLNITQNQIHGMSKLIFSDEAAQITHDYLPLTLFDNMVTIVENVMMDTERRFQRVKL